MLDMGTHIVQAFNLALINSDTFKKGILPIIIIVVASRCRGPSSPAGNISIFK